MLIMLISATDIITYAKTIQAFISHGLLEFVTIHMHMTFLQQDKNMCHLFIDETFLLLIHTKASSVSGEHISFA